MEKLKLNKTNIASLDNVHLQQIVGGDGENEGSDRLCTNIPCYTAGCATRYCETRYCQPTK